MLRKQLTSLWQWRSLEENVCWVWVSATVVYFALNTSNKVFFFFFSFWTGQSNCGIFSVENRSTYWEFFSLSLNISSILRRTSTNIFLADEHWTTIQYFIGWWIFLPSTLESIGHTGLPLQSVFYTKKFRMMCFRVKAYIISFLFHA